MTKHTPGPWEVVRTPNGYPCQITATAGDPRKPGGICDVTRWASISVPSSAEGEANARLIAAAPDMLAALKDCRAYLAGFMNVKAHGNGPIVALAAADAAIAKAEGAS